MSGDRILLVEDDKEIREGVEIFLKSQGYEVFQAADGLRAWKSLKSAYRSCNCRCDDAADGRYYHGSKTAGKFRLSSTFPICKSEEVDKILGLNMGADDYITKPFTPMELLARVNSHLRRYHRVYGPFAFKAEESARSLPGRRLEVNEDTVSVTIDDRPVKVTPIEFKILLLLIRNPGRVFPADEIYERVWNERAINTDTVMVHIRNLREKIEVNPKEPKYLKVVWGVGYKIEKQP